MKRRVSGTALKALKARKDSINGYCENAPLNQNKQVLGLSDLLFKGIIIKSYVLFLLLNKEDDKTFS